MRSAASLPVPSTFRAGDLVEVRSEDEILATLDENGTLDGLPFMPEMLRFCGGRFLVQNRAHKTCDTILGTGMRRLDKAVHLTELRCDGSGHGGCQAACLLFWKEEWIRPVETASAAGDDPPPAIRGSESSIGRPGCTREMLAAATRGRERRTARRRSRVRRPSFGEPRRRWRGGTHASTRRIWSRGTSLRRGSSKASSSCC